PWKDLRHVADASHRSLLPGLPALELELVGVDVPGGRGGDHLQGHGLAHRHGDREAIGALIRVDNRRREGYPAAGLPTTGGRCERADRVEDRLAARPRDGPLELVGCRARGGAGGEGDVVVVEADADVEGAALAGEVEIASAVALDAGLHVVPDPGGVGGVVDHGLGGAVGGGIVTAPGGAGRERGGVDAATVGRVARGGLAAGSVQPTYEWRSRTDAGVTDVTGGAGISIVAGDVVGGGVAAGARAIAGVGRARIVVVALIGRATGIREEREARRVVVGAGGGVLGRGARIDGGGGGSPAPGARGPPGAGPAQRAGVVR